MLDDVVSSDETWVPLSKRAHLSIFRIIAICGSLISYQVGYSVEYSLGTPLLMHFGTSQLYLAVVWSVAPLSGFIIQPLVGYYSDRLLWKMGKRRPFILVGCIGIIVGLIVMAVLERIGKTFTPDNADNTTVAAFSINLLWLNVFLNILQGPARALLADLIPESQQMLGNTIASLLMCLSAFVVNVIGAFGNIPGHPMSNELLMIITSIGLVAFGLIITMIWGSEEQNFESGKKESVFWKITETVVTVPSEIRIIAIVYFFSWLSYFPFQVTATDYFGTDIFGGSSDFETGKRWKYDNGVSFGMGMIALGNLLVIVYSSLQKVIRTTLGMRGAYAFSQGLATVCLFLAFFIKNKYVMLIVLSFVSISFALFNSVPHAVIGLIKPEKMGTYMAALNCYGLLGQQFSLSLICAGIGCFTDKKGFIIGAGSFPALIAAILSYWIRIPKTEKSNIDSLIYNDPFRTQ